MAAQILQFPKPAKQPFQPSRETQAHADRIVAQIEREIANQAYQQSQMRFDFIPPPIVVEMETPAMLAKRILRAIFSLDRSA